jgi:MioC protein
MKLTILVGTVTHTAETAAKAIQLDCADRVAVIDVRLMEGLDIGAFEEDALYLICTSTYGAGDVPDNARDLYDSLDLTPKYLGGLRYGVLALGDRAGHGATFGFAGLQFDERLQGLGAQRLGEIGFLDASDGTLPEEEGVAWARQWLDLAVPAFSTSGKP